MSRESGYLAGLRALTLVDRPADATAVYDGEIDPVFTIGPKVHGGSAQMLSALAAQTGFVDTAEASGAGPVDPPSPVAISSDFLHAPDPGAVQVRVWVRKRGRQVSVVEVDLQQNGRTTIHSSVTLGRLDDTASTYSADHPLLALPVEPPADALALADTPVAQINHLTALLDFAAVGSSLPFLEGGQGEPRTLLWLKPKGEEPDAGFTILCADISMPVVMNRGMFGWAPTVQLSTYVRRNPAPGWLRVSASSSEIQSGWFEEDHVVIDSTGAVVAQSRQLALIPQG
ncbi:thioesterase family protein [Williamsia sterculiae]|uniref:Thioesterase-like superfamily protein n=1 Tax=Williamsia sterculiae TaxID=1344003 RepID=A0A1N7CVZ4_9NOCA|nr:thioesterase family protein [Williamsia sterculiae]SIR67749.1 Thioesterase-like superfamily protein [Williamsia sterculiae]